MKQSRCFSGIPLLILWYNTCCLFDLWFIVFSKSGLCIWKFLVHILLMPNLKDFEYYIASMWKESNCIVVWTFFGIAFLWDWSENCFLWPLLSFQNLDLLYTSSVFRIHCLSFPEYQWVVSERRGASHRCLLCNPEHRAVHKDNWKNKGILGHFHSDADILQTPASPIQVQLQLPLVFYFDPCDASSARDWAGVSELIKGQVLSGHSTNIISSNSHKNPLG